MKNVLSHSLTTGRTVSCGCYNSENSRKRFSTHGMTNTRAFKTWSGIKNRCFNEKAHGFCRYGGRGITMCKEWKNDFLSFYEYVSKLPNAFETGYSLDRINNDGNYEPCNVRWATNTEQVRNREKSIFYEENGLKIHIVDVSKLVGIPYGTLKSRHQSNNNILKDEEKLKLHEALKRGELCN